MSVRFTPIAIALSSLLAVVACSDAKPGTADDDSGSAASNSSGGGGLATGGGFASGGAGAAGGAAPDFATATVTLLSPPVLTTPGAFGGVVAVSGETVLVGARQQNAQAGAIHVFAGVGANWTHVNALQAQMAVSDDLFGSSLAFSGDIAVAGAPGRGMPEFAGSAFVLRRNGQSWVSQFELKEKPGVELARFGAAVALSGNRVAVGAPDIYEYGRVSFFTASGNDWVPDGEVTSTVESQAFGQALALDGDTVVIGAPGFTAPPAAYVYVRQNGDWVQQAQLIPGDGAVGKKFGTSVALSGNTAIVGTGSTDLNETSAVYVFTRTGDSWSQQTQLEPRVNQPGSRFGRAVAISGNVLLVGAPRDNELAETSGAAYVFARSGSDWTEQTKLLQPQGKKNDQFGVSVAVDGKVAVVGSQDVDDPSGFATVFVVP